MYVYVFQREFDQFPYQDTCLLWGKAIAFLTNNIVLD